MFTGCLAFSTPSLHTHKQKKTHSQTHNIKNPSLFDEKERKAEGGRGQERTLTAYVLKSEMKGRKVTLFLVSPALFQPVQTFRYHLISHFKYFFQYYLIKS